MKSRLLINIIMILDFYFILLYAAAYFVLVATIAALTGQHVVRKIIAVLGRASIIIFILAFTIFVSAISLGTFHYFNWKSYGLFYFYFHFLFLFLVFSVSKFCEANCENRFHFQFS